MKAYQALKGERVMCVLLLVCFVLWGIMPFGTAAAASSGDMNSAIDITAEWAVGTDSGDSQKLQLRLEPEIYGSLYEGWDILFRGRADADAFDRLRRDDEDRAELSMSSRYLSIGDRVELSVREAYAQHYFDGIFVRAGKQQIVWGKSDGLKVLDVVNPQDYREFILPDYEDSRIPLWSLDVEVPVGEGSLQLVWVPDRTYNDIPGTGDLFAFTSPMLVPEAPSGIMVDTMDVRRPDRLFADSDYGARLSSLAGSWDIALSYFYHYTDDPVLYQSLSMETGLSVITVTPEYERTHMAGFSCSNSFGDITLRCEIAWFSDKYFIADFTQGNNGIVRSGELDYVIGLDWSGPSDFFTSVQFFQSLLPEDSEGITRDRVENYSTVYMKKQFMYQTLEARIMWLHNYNQGDGLIRPRVTYEVTDNMKMWTGSDIFYGSQGGTFGQFGRNDRVFAGMELAL